MEIENQNHEEILQSKKNNIAIKTLGTPKMMRLILLLLNILLLLIGATGSPLILRAYFLHGGNRKWFSGFLQTAGFPFLLIPILIAALRRCQAHSRLFSLTPKLLLSCNIIGLFTGIVDYLCSFGLSFLPVSTASLLLSMQLGFTAIFAFFIMKQKFSSFTVNAVVLLTFGAVVLGVHANGDRPNGESKSMYYLGFAVILVAAIIYSMVLPFVKLMYMRAKQEVTYVLVKEMQFVIGFFATLVCAIGMEINNDFQAIPREGKHNGLDEAKYYLVVFFTTIISQFFFVGVVGTVKYSSALLNDVIVAACIPITQVLAILFFHENFDEEKGVDLALSLWDTASYLYGEYKEYKKSKAVAKESQLLRPFLVVS